MPCARPTAAAEPRVADTDRPPLERSTGAALRPDGSIVLAGALAQEPLNPYSPPTDAVALLLDGTTGSLLTGQVLGGTGWEGIADVVVDATGAVYLGGQTNSPDFFTGALMTGSSGTTTTDGFVVKLSFPALTLTPSTRRIAYGYDALNRLTSATESGASTASYGYAYDRAGNRTSVTTNGVAQTFSFNSVNEITNPGWRYDATGNLTSTGTIDYTYDALGRMASQLVGGGRTDYIYNGDGVLACDARGVTVNQYAQDLAAPLPQVLQINQDSVYYGRDRLATDLVPFARQWYIHDALGSTRQTVVGGGTLNAGRYDPWGTPIDNQIAPFGFAGELQGDGGLVYLRARWYTPQQGVFTSRDPFAGWAERPSSQHSFQYGYSNPVLVTDPSGRCAEGWEGDCFGPLDIPDPLTADEWVEAGSGIVDALPIVGDAKGLIEVFTGCDLVTGAELGHWRWLGLIALSELRLGRRRATAGAVGRGVRGAPAFGDAYYCFLEVRWGVDQGRTTKDQAPGVGRSSLVVGRNPIRTSGTRYYPITRAWYRAHDDMLLVLSGADGQQLRITSQ